MLLLLLRTRTAAPWVPPSNVLASRRLVLPPEDRTLQVPAEKRTAYVPFEPRTLKRRADN